MGGPSASFAGEPDKAIRYNKGQAAEGTCNDQSAELRTNITEQRYRRQGTTRVNETGSGSQSL